MSHQPGQYIDLREEGGDPYLDEIIAHGHVDHATLVASATDWLTEWYDGNEDTPEMNYGPVRFLWARWSFSGGHNEDGRPSRTLATYHEGGRGRFPVTVATSQREIDRRAKRQAQEEADVAWILARHPTATITSRNAYGRQYRFTLPNLAGDVTMTWGNGKLEGFVQQRDLAAWNAYIDSKAPTPKGDEKP